MNNKTTHILGEDLGMGANKLYGAAGGLEMPSQVALNGGQQITRILGLRNQKPPLLITTDHGEFHVGAGAHDAGRPVENLGFDKFNGSPELEAVFLGALTRYFEKFNIPGATSLMLAVGLPHELMSGEEANTNVNAVRRWLMGEHFWEASRRSYQAKVEKVIVTSQAAAAIFDRSLDEQGHFQPGGRIILNKENGVISIGLHTVELLVVRDKRLVQRFTAGATSGVRRLLEIVNTGQMYSLGELDTLLRAGRLDIKEALPVWEREVTGVIERHWGQSWKRFESILLVGGGAVLLKDSLLYRFAGKAIIPDEPVLSIARGLYKLGLFQDRRKRR